MKTIGLLALILVLDGTNAVPFSIPFGSDDSGGAIDLTGDGVTLKTKTSSVQNSNSEGREQNTFHTAGQSADGSYEKDAEQQRFHSSQLSERKSQEESLSLGRGGLGLQRSEETAGTRKDVTEEETSLRELQQGQTGNTQYQSDTSSQEGHKHQHQEVYGSKKTSGFGLTPTGLSQNEHGTRYSKVSDSDQRFKNSQTQREETSNEPGNSRTRRYVAGNHQKSSGFQQSQTEDQYGSNFYGQADGFKQGGAQNSQFQDQRFYPNSPNYGQSHNNAGDLRQLITGEFNNDNYRSGNGYRGSENYEPQFTKHIPVNSNNGFERNRQGIENYAPGNLNRAGSKASEVLDYPAGSSGYGSVQRFGNEGLGVYNFPYNAYGPGDDYRNRNHATGHRNVQYEVPHERDINEATGLKHVEYGIRNDRGNINQAAGQCNINYPIGHDLYGYGQANNQYGPGNGNVESLNSNIRHIGYEQFGVLRPESNPNEHAGEKLSSFAAGSDSSSAVAGSYLGGYNLNPYQPSPYGRPMSTADQIKLQGYLNNNAHHMSSSTSTSTSASHRQDSYSAIQETETSNSAATKPHVSEYLQNYGMYNKNNKPATAKHVDESETNKSLKHILPGVNIHGIIDDTPFLTGDGRYILVPGKDGNEHRYYDTVTKNYYNVKRVKLSGNDKIVIVPGDHTGEAPDNEGPKRFGKGLHLGHGVYYIGNRKYKFEGKTISASDISKFIGKRGFRIHLTPEGLPLGHSNKYYPIDVGYGVYYLGNGYYKYENQIISVSKIVEFTKSRGFHIKFTKDGFPKDIVNSSESDDDEYQPIDLGNNLYFLGNGHYKYFDRIIPATHIFEFLKTVKLSVPLTPDGLPFGLSDGPIQGGHSFIHLGYGIFYLGKHYYRYLGQVIPASEIRDFLQSLGISDKIRLTDDGLPADYTKDSDKEQNAPQHLGYGIYYLGNRIYRYKEEIISAEKISTFVARLGFPIKFTQDGLPLTPNKDTKDETKNPKGKENEPGDKETPSKNKTDRKDKYPIDLGDGLYYLGNLYYKYHDHIIEASKMPGLLKIIGRNVTLPTDNQLSEKPKNTKETSTDRNDEVHLGHGIYYLGNDKYKFRDHIIPKDLLPGLLKILGVHLHLPGGDIDEETTQKTSDQSPKDLGHGIYYLGNGTYKYNDILIPEKRFKGFLKILRYRLSVSKPGTIVGPGPRPEDSEDKIKELIYKLLAAKEMDDNTETESDDNTGDEDTKETKTTTAAPDVTTVKKTEDKNEKTTKEKAPKDLGHGIYDNGDGTYKYRDITIPEKDFKGFLKILRYRLSRSKPGTIVGPGPRPDDSEDKIRELIYKLLAKKELDKDDTTDDEDTKETKTTTVVTVTPKTKKTEDKNEKKTKETETETDSESDDTTDEIDINETKTTTAAPNVSTTKKSTDNNMKTTDENTSKDLGHGIYDNGDGTYKYKDIVIPQKHFKGFLKILRYRFSRTTPGTLVGPGPRPDDSEDKIRELLNKLLAKKETDTEADAESDDTTDDEDTKESKTTTVAPATPTTKKTEDKNEKDTKETETETDSESDDTTDEKDTKESKTTTATPNVTTTKKSTDNNEKGTDEKAPKDLGHGIYDNGDGTYKYKDIVIPEKHFKGVLKILRYRFSRSKPGTIVGRGPKPEDSKDKIRELIYKLLAKKETHTESDDTTDDEDTKETKATTAAPDVTKTKKPKDKNENSTDKKTPKDLGYGIYDNGDGTYKYKNIVIPEKHFKGFLKILRYRLSRSKPGTLVGPGPRPDDSEDKIRELINDLLAKKEGDSDTESDDSTDGKDTKETKTATAAPDATTTKKTNDNNKKGTPTDLGQGIYDCGDGTYKYKDIVIPEKHFYGVLKILRYRLSRSRPGTIVGPGPRPDDSEDKIRELIYKLLAKKETEKETDTESDNTAHDKDTKETKTTTASPNVTTTNKSTDNNEKATDTNTPKDLGHGIYYNGDGTYKYKDIVIPGKHFKRLLKILGYRVSRSKPGTIVGRGAKPGVSEDKIRKSISKLLAKKETDTKTNTESADTTDVEDTKETKTTTAAPDVTSTKKSSDNNEKTTETDGTVDKKESKEIKTTTAAPDGTTTKKAEGKNDQTANENPLKDLGHGIYDCSDSTYKYKGIVIPEKHIKDVLKLLRYRFSRSRPGTIVGPGPRSEDSEDKIRKLINELLAQKAAEETTDTESDDTTDDNDTKETKTSTVAPATIPSKKNENNNEKPTEANTPTETKTTTAAPTATTTKKSTDNNEKATDTNTPKDLGHGIYDNGDGTYKYKDIFITEKHFKGVLKILRYRISHRRPGTIVGPGPRPEDGEDEIRKLIYKLLAKEETDQETDTDSEDTADDKDNKETKTTTAPPSVTTTKKSTDNNEKTTDTNTPKDLGHGIYYNGDGTYKYKDIVIPGKHFKGLLKILGYRISQSKPGTIVGHGPKPEVSEDEIRELIYKLLEKKDTDTETNTESDNTKDDEDTKETKTTTAAPNVTTTKKSTDNNEKATDKNTSKDLGHGIYDNGDGTYKYKDIVIPEKHFKGVLKILRYRISRRRTGTVVGPGPRPEDNKDKIREQINKLLAKKETDKEATKDTDDNTDTESDDTTDDEYTKGTKTTTSAPDTTTTKKAEDKNEKTSNEKAPKHLGHGIYDCGDGTYKYKDIVIPDKHFKGVLKMLRYRFSRSKPGTIVGRGPRPEESEDKIRELIYKLLENKETDTERNTKSDDTSDDKDPKESKTTTAAPDVTTTEKPEDQNDQTTNKKTLKDLGHGIYDCGDGTYKYKDIVIPEKHFKGVLKILRYRMSRSKPDTIVGRGPRPGDSEDKIRELINKLLAMKETDTETDTESDDTTDDKDTRGTNSLTVAPATPTTKKTEDKNEKTSTEKAPKDLGYGIYDNGDGTYKYRDITIPEKHLKVFLKILRYRFSRSKPGTLVGPGPKPNDSEDRIRELIKDLLAKEEGDSDTESDDTTDDEDTKETKTTTTALDVTTTKKPNDNNEKYTDEKAPKDLGHGIYDCGDGTYKYKDIVIPEKHFKGVLKILRYRFSHNKPGTIVGPGPRPEDNEDKIRELIYKLLVQKSAEENTDTESDGTTDDKDTKETKTSTVAPATTTSKQTEDNNEKATDANTPKETKTTTAAPNVTTKKFRDNNEKTTVANTPKDLGYGIYDNGDGTYKYRNITIPEKHFKGVLKILRYKISGSKSGNIVGSGPRPEDSDDKISKLIYELLAQKAAEENTDTESYDTTDDEDTKERKTTTAAPNVTTIKKSTDNDEKSTESDSTVNEKESKEMKSTTAAPDVTTTKKAEDKNGKTTNENALKDLGHGIYDCGDGTYNYKDIIIPENRLKRFLNILGYRISRTKPGTIVGPGPRPEDSEAKIRELIYKLLAKKDTEDDVEIRSYDTTNDEESNITQTTIAFTDVASTKSPKDKNTSGETGDGKGQDKQSPKNPGKPSQSDQDNDSPILDNTSGSTTSSKSSSSGSNSTPSADDDDNTNDDATLDDNTTSNTTEASTGNVDSSNLSTWSSNKNSITSTKGGESSNTPRKNKIRNNKKEGKPTRNTSEVLNSSKTGRNTSTTETTDTSIYDNNSSSIEGRQVEKNIYVPHNPKTNRTKKVRDVNLSDDTDDSGFVETLESQHKKKGKKSVTRSENSDKSSMYSNSSETTYKSSDSNIESDTKNVFDQRDKERLTKETSGNAENTNKQSSNNESKTTGRPADLIKETNTAEDSSSNQESKGKRQKGSNFQYFEEKDDSYSGNSDRDSKGNKKGKKTKGYSTSNDKNNKSTDSVGWSENASQSTDSITKPKTTSDSSSKIETKKRRNKSLTDRTSASSDNIEDASSYDKQVNTEGKAKQGIISSGVNSNDKDTSSGNTAGSKNVNTLTGANKQSNITRDSTSEEGKQRKKNNKRTNRSKIDQNTGNDEDDSSFDRTVESKARDKLSNLTKTSNSSKHLSSNEENKVRRRKGNNEDDESSVASENDNVLNKRDKKSQGSATESNKTAKDESSSSTNNSKSDNSSSNFSNKSNKSGNESSNEETKEKTSKGNKSQTRYKTKRAEIDDEISSSRDTKNNKKSVHTNSSTRNGSNNAQDTKTSDAKLTYTSGASSSQSDAEEFDNADASSSSNSGTNKSSNSNSDDSSRIRERKRSKQSRRYKIDGTQIRKRNSTENSKSAEISETYSTANNSSNVSKISNSENKQSKSFADSSNDRSSSDSASRRSVDNAGSSDTNRSSNQQNRSEDGQTESESTQQSSSQPNSAAKDKENKSNSDSQVTQNSSSNSGKSGSSKTVIRRSSSQQSFSQSSSESTSIVESNDDDGSTITQTSSSNKESEQNRQSASSSQESIKTGSNGTSRKKSKSSSSSSSASEKESSSSTTSETKNTSN